MPPKLIWRLRHAWRSEADRKALALCRDRLARIGVELVDAGPGEVPDAIKMHGMEIAGARAAGAPALHDLREVAVAAGWEERLPRFVRGYMVSGDRWHGIPMGVHRANVVWVNAELAGRIGRPAPDDGGGLLDWLAHARRWTASPLAVGAEAWQVGVLFESTVLGVAGPHAYRRAFEHLDRSVWREASMVEAIDRLMALRGHVSDEHLGLSWAEQAARVQRGEAAIQWMGDWVRAAGFDGLLEWEAPGTAGSFVAIVDFFAPLANEATAVPADRIAATLTEPGFQHDFAMRKGCLPAVRDAWRGFEPRRARMLQREGDVLPSLTFDQCCAVAARQAILEVVADHFVHRRSARALASALAGQVG